MTKIEITQLIEEKLQKVDNPNPFPYIIDSRLWTTNVA